MKEQLKKASLVCHEKALLDLEKDLCLNGFTNYTVESFSTVGKYIEIIFPERRKDSLTKITEDLRKKYKDE